MRRIIVVSDLHVGGNSFPMLGRPDYLQDFLEQLAIYVPRRHEELELVINGDFIDFLAESPHAAWTATEKSALQKFQAIAKRHPALFGALRKCVSKLPRCTIILGNHDIELAYPRVRDELFRELNADAHGVVFTTTNEAYRIGGVLIEHGNRYDPWNAIDHDGLRQIVSASSRGESPPSDLRVCPGSYLVHEVMNPLKERYHFVDLLKPEDKLVLLLLTTLEPKLKFDLKTVLQAATKYVAYVYHDAQQAEGEAPAERHLISAQDSTRVNEELPTSVTAAFADELRLEENTRRNVSVVNQLHKLFLKDPTESLYTKLEQGELIEPYRLKKLQLALKHKLYNDTTFREDDHTGPFAAAARRMIQSGVASVVIMGHTHLARRVAIDSGWYLNTGTWADLIRIDESLLQDTDTSRSNLLDWLGRLVSDKLDGIRFCAPTYADVIVDDNGNVVGEPKLRRYEERSAFG
jgi:UDP-2,3-diacylglucosamine pyrophosphatase LpxH